MVSTSVLTLLIFNSLFFCLVVGQPPSEGPFPATSSWNGTSISGANSSITPNPALIPLNGTLNSSTNSSIAEPPTTNCSCSLKPSTLIACAIVVIRGEPIGFPRDVCCAGLQGLSDAAVYSCLCYAFTSRILSAPGINITVPAAMRVVSLACRLSH